MPVRGLLKCFGRPQRTHFKIFGPPDFVMRPYTLHLAATPVRREHRRAQARRVPASAAGHLLRDDAVRRCHLSTQINARFPKPSDLPIPIGNYAQVSTLRPQVTPRTPYQFGPKARSPATAGDHIMYVT